MLIKHDDDEGERGRLLMLNLEEGKPSFPSRRQPAVNANPSAIVCRRIDIHRDETDPHGLASPAGGRAVPRRRPTGGAAGGARRPVGSPRPDSSFVGRGVVVRRGPRLQMELPSRPCGGVVSSEGLHPTSRGRGGGGSRSRRQAEAEERGEKA